jgi:hypothetical protein
MPRLLSPVNNELEVALVVNVRQSVLQHICGASAENHEKPQVSMNEIRSS